MIRLWSAEAPLTWPSSNRSRPRTRMPGRVEAQYAAALPKAPRPDDDDVPVRALGGHERMVGGRRRVVGAPVPPRGVRTIVCYGVRMNVRTNLMLPEELVEAIDEVAGPRGRSRWVTDGARAPVASRSLVRRREGDGWRVEGPPAVPDRRVRRRVGSSVASGRHRSMGRPSVKYLLDSTFVIDHERNVPAAIDRLRRLYEEVTTRW